MAKRRSTLAGAILCTALLSMSLPACAADEPANHLDLARVAAGEHRYAAAVDHLQQFSRGSIVEPRADEAHDLLLAIAGDWSADFERRGKTAFAARALLRCAQALGEVPDATDLRTKARRTLDTGYEKAMTAKDAGRALAIASAANKLFPDAPIGTAATLKILEAGALSAQLGKARPEYLYTRFRALEADGILPGVFEEHKLRSDELLLDDAEALQDRGWYSQAMRVLRDAPATEKTSPQLKKQLEAALAKATVSHADAALAFGNVRQAHEAMELCLGIAETIDPSQLTRLKAAVEKLGPVSPPMSFPLGDPIRGNATWTDTAAGYVLDDVVQTGNSKADRGGDWFTANVQAQSGFFLEGGTLRASHGVLEFKGTPDKPVILRRVRIECDYTATVKAQHTIFQDCIFTKSGNWFWNDGYSSKWAFTDCLIQRSNFPTLKKIDYGIKLVRCAFDECKLPPRMLTDKPGQDGGAIYRGEWNQVDECDFYHCDVPASALWMTRTCNFYQCSLTGGATFTSKSSIDVQMGVPAEEGDLVDELAAVTTVRGAGVVTYSRPAGLFPRAKPTTLWKWAQDSSPRLTAVRR